LDLDALGNIGDFVGGIGVIVTLGFLVFQIRQNTAQLRQQNELSAASAARSRRETSNETFRLLATDRDLLRVYWAGCEDRDSLDSLDQQQFDAIVSLFFQAQLEAFKVGNEEALENGIFALATWPGIRQWLDVWAASLPADFCEYLAQYLNRTDSTAQDGAAADST
jgi:hypothetical protein